ncbi:hypothetical protein HDK64DRAFT_335025 [Phyllosticta capitalensis]
MEVVSSKHGDTQTKEVTEIIQDATPFSDDESQMRWMNGKSLGWTPAFLKRNSFSGFIVCYLYLLLGLAILATMDSRKNGIATAKATDHYLWTYGPTAVLAIVAAYWGQVEHRTKQAMPWVLLKKKVTTASDTLLLDYVTLSQTEAFVKSLRQAHWPVVVAIVGSLLIKLLTVASTGLLVLQTAEFHNPDCNLFSSDEFVMNFQSSEIGSSIVLATLALNNGTMDYPPGTTADMAFQTLKVPEFYLDSENFQAEAIVRAFQGEFDCEIATLRSYDSNSNGYWTNQQLDIDSPSCQVTDITYSQKCSTVDPTTNECDFGDAIQINCNTTTGNPDPKRLVVLAGRAQKGYQNPGVENTPIGPILLDHTAALVCYPKYSIKNVRAKFDSAGNLLENTFIDLDHTTPEYTGWDLLEGLQASTAAAGLVLDTPFYYRSGVRELSRMWPFIDLFANSTYTASELQNPDTLKKATTSLFSMVTAQMAKHELMYPAEESKEGTCYSTEQRLRVRGLSLYLMAALLVLKIAVALVMFQIAPRNFAPRDPATIGDLALILANSPSLLDRLRHQGSSDVDDIRAHLMGIKCQSKIEDVGDSHRFLVEIFTESRHVEKATEKENATIKRWRPLSINPFFKILVALSLILVAVVLEILYWRSEKSNGLAQVDAQGYIRFVWVYIPAIVMLTVQTLIGTVAFSTVFIFPFHVLRTKYSSTRDDILREYVSMTAFQSLLKSAMNRHFPVILMAVTMLLAPLLTIVVSGLYTAQGVELHQLVTLSTVNQFNSSYQADDLGFGANYDAFKQASMNIGLLTTQNFSYPAWTYDELAFPEVKFEDASIQDELSSFSANNKSKLYTRLPAIRGDLNCSLTPGAPKNISDWLYGTYDFQEYTKLRCDKGSEWLMPGSNAFGYFDINMGPRGSDFGNKICGAYGTDDSNWRAFTCGFSIQQFSTSVTLSATSLAILDASIDTSIPPQVFSNQTFSASFMYAFPTGMMSSAFGSGSFLFDSTGPSVSNSSMYDPAFQAAIYQLGTTKDPNSFPMQDYMDDTGFEKMTASLTRVYRILVAQTANLAIRVPFDASAPHSPAASSTATLTVLHVSRLMQSAVSTHILGVLLVVLALCVGLSLWVMDTRRVLPKNPASIAAGASLLAGNSEMLSAEGLKGEAQWWDPRELQNKGVWQGYVFSLGWWGAGEQGPHGEKKRFGIDVGRADR